MRRIFLALICACAMALVGCGSPANAVGDGSGEAPSSVEAEQPQAGKPEAEQPGEDGEGKAEELASAGLRNVEIMGFEIYEPIESTMIRNDCGVAWTDEHGCTLTVVVQDVPEGEDLSTESKRTIFGARLIHTISEMDGWLSLDAFGDGTAHYSFQFIDEDGELRDGEIKEVTDGERVFGGQIRYTDGHEDRVELFDLDSFRVAGEPVG